MPPLARGSLGTARGSVGKAASSSGNLVGAAARAWTIGAALTAWRSWGTCGGPYNGAASMRGGGATSTPWRNCVVAVCTSTDTAPRACCSGPATMVCTGCGASTKVEATAVACNLGPCTTMAFVVRGMIRGSRLEAKVLLGDCPASSEDSPLSAKPPICSKSSKTPSCKRCVRAPSRAASSFFLSILLLANRHMAIATNTKMKRMMMTMNQLSCSPCCPLPLLRLLVREVPLADPSPNATDIKSGALLQSKSVPRGMEASVLGETMETVSQPHTEQSYPDFTSCKVPEISSHQSSPPEFVL
mmetsp:Transcript_135945/g.344219  ORF Transcript_135945/g.344219 Transcript_135945/m.344219 type:complete len:301 (-) Transcript_135945:46-948(-)